MQPQRNPAPLAGGDRAGNEYAEQLFLTRESAEAQGFRRQRLDERLHDLGAHIPFEFIDQLERDHHLGAAFDRQLERFASIDPDVLSALGSDKFPSPPLRVVGRKS